MHFYKAMWTYYRKWGRFRSNPLVLVPFLVALIGMGTLEGLLNAVRSLRPRRGSGAPA
jgi:hypothetical protein